MPRLTCIALFFLVALGVVSGCTTPPPTHSVVVLDLSASSVPSSNSDSAASCAIMSELINRAIRQYSSDSRSTIQVIGTGSIETSLAPLVILSRTAIPARLRAIEGKGKVSRVRAALVERAGVACHAADHASRISPIYLAISVAIKELRAAGCTPEGRCALLIASDLEETAEVWLAEALQKASFTQTSIAPVTGLLDASGIEVVACGFAQSRGQLLSVERLERRELVWSQVLSSASSFRVEPICQAGK